MSQPTDASAAGLILIADDNPEARRMLEVRVKREGHQTILVGNGREALDVLARQPVDLVLLDIDMPELDGYGVLAAIKGDPKLAHLPVIIISGGGDQDDLVRCIEMGAVDYLPKPFNQAILRARVAACLSQRKRPAEPSKVPEAAGNDANETAVLTYGRRAAAPEKTPGGEANKTAVVNVTTAEWNLITAIPPPVAPAQARPSGVPERVGRIALRQVLGKGGMGQVFLGYHELLDMPVAVKIVRSELTATPAMRLRLLHEARLAARMAHRHIVRLIEIGEFDQNVYLAFEYVVGGTLAALLTRQPDHRLPINTAIRFAREIGLALAEANQLNIVHRDIKPGNLLLTADGEIKVADFGLAKQYTLEAAASPQLTIEGTVSGTPMYMAPEQLLLGAKLDIRTDLYALGCVLYEMLVGHAPFESPDRLDLPADIPLDSKYNVFFHQTNTTPPSPTRFRADVPTWLDALSMKLLSKLPHDRYPTPEAFLKALDAGGG